MNIMKCNLSKIPTRNLILLISFVSISSCSFDKGGLEKNTRTIELNYVAWACDCANWTMVEDMGIFSGDSLADRSIFIEPASKELILPDTLGYNNDLIKFTGQFYNEKGIPKGYKPIQTVEKASVFRYTKYEVLLSNYSEYIGLEKASKK